MAGRDINILEKLFQSNINIVCVGDNKQATFQTHSTKTNKGKTGKNIFEFCYSLQEKGIVQVQESLQSRRFNTQICSFANRVYPNDKNMTSDMTEETEHDGVFLIAKRMLLCIMSSFHRKNLGTIKGQLILVDMKLLTSVNVKEKHMSVA